MSLSEFSTQLTLGISLQAETTFSNFIVGQNRQLLFQIKAFLNSSEEHFFYLSGTKGSGKSHLLQACCHETSFLKKTSIYIPLLNFHEFDTRFFENLEMTEVICVDDIQCISNNALWEEMVFHLYNRSKTANTKLMVSGDVSPAELNIALPDLKSRLSWGFAYHLMPLRDEDKIQALQTRAKERGFEITNEVAMFLLNRCSRDSVNLFSILDQLDHASLSAQRRITVPFVKEVLKI